jgi:hypothetical protein
METTINVTISLLYYCTEYFQTGTVVYQYDRLETMIPGMYGTKLALSHHEPHQPKRTTFLLLLQYILIGQVRASDILFLYTRVTNYLHLIATVKLQRFAR